MYFENWLLKFHTVTIFNDNISQPGLRLLSAGGFGFPFHGRGKVANTPAPHPALKTPAVPPAPRPAAPTLWHMANNDPDATAGPCRDAAILPAATPAAVNPTAPKTKGVAATAPAPAATGTPTSEKTLNFSPNVRRTLMRSKVTENSANYCFSGKKIRSLSVSRVSISIITSQSH